MKNKNFFRIAGLGAGLALVAAVAGCMSPARAPEGQKSETPPPAVQGERQAAAVPSEAATATGPTAEVKKEAIKTPAGSNPAPRVYSPDDPDNPIYLGTGGRLAGRGDPNRPASDAYRVGMGAHSPALQSAGVHKDKFGLIDWVAMVDKDVIRPISSLEAGAEEAPPLEMDIVISPKSDFVKDVVFPHRQHTYWNSCAACHDKLFVMAKGENKMTMKGITEGKWCGACHGKVAFPLADCARCHSREKAAGGV